MISRFGFPFILVSFILLALAFSVIVPLGEAPDEVPHWSYVQYLVEHQRLPLPEGAVRGESHQPPLYYILGAAATLPIQRDGFQVIANPKFVLKDPRTPNLLVHDSREAFPYRDNVLAWHLARVLSIAMGAVTVWATWRTAREIFPDDERIALGAAAFVAFLPGFVFISAAVNNDNLVVMLSSLCILQVVRMMRRPLGTRDTVLLGILLGFAALTKLSGFVVWLFAAAIFVWMASRRGEQKNTAIYFAICFGIAAAIIAPWIIYNLIEYRDPLGWSVILATTPARESPMKIADWISTAKGLYTSFWGRFGGALQIRMPNLIYAMLGVSGLVALCGWIQYARDAREPKNANARKLFLLFSFFWILLLAAYVRIALAIGGTDQARLLFPGLSLLAIFVMAGLTRLFGARANIAIVILSAMLGAMNLVVLDWLHRIYSLIT